MINKLSRIKGSINKRLIAKTIFLILIFSIVTVWYANYKVVDQTESQIYSNIQKVPSKRVGLLLGTSKYLKSGQENLYFKYRIDAAVELYEAGKIKYILVSGDNGREEYNEPEDMQMELINRCIPPEKIFLDYAGFRTYDSVVRANKVFGQSTFTVISQKFHNQRAIYII